MVMLVHETYVKELKRVKDKIALEKSKTITDLRKQKTLKEDTLTELSTFRSNADSRKPSKKRPTNPKKPSSVQPMLKKKTTTSVPESKDVMGMNSAKKVLQMSVTK